jgi:hypothetical protein
LKTYRLHVTALTLILMALWATDAWAGNWDRPTGLDQWIDFDLCDLNTGQHDTWHSNNSHDIAPTAIIPTHTHSCSTIEVRVNDSAYGSNQPPGWWECHDVSGSVCLSGHVHINTDKANSYSAALKLALMCQEVGHSVGLAHADSGNSCMNNPLSTDRQHLVQHDIDILNAQYG